MRAHALWEPNPAQLGQQVLVRVPFRGAAVAEHHPQSLSAVLVRQSHPDGVIAAQPDVVVRVTDADAAPFHLKLDTARVHNDRLAVLLEELLEVVQAMTLVLMQEMDGVMMQHTGPLMDMTCVILEQMTQTVRVVDIIKL